MRRLLPLALLAATACLDDLEPQYRVTDLRILAVRSEIVDADGTSWADAVPGATLELEVLVANPRARAPLEVSWYACAPTAEGLPACLDQAVLREPGALAARASDPTSGVVQLASGARPEAIPLERYAAEIEAALLAVEALAVDKPTWLCRAYVEIPVAVVAEAEGRREVAVKRVRVTRETSDPDPDYVRNANPVIGNVLRATTEEACASGSPLETGAPFADGLGVLCGLSAHEPQRYNVCGSGGEHLETLESLEWQWFVTAGEFPEVEGVGNATGSTPEFEPPPEPFTLWAVLRDGRGGVAEWREYRDLAP